MSGPRLGALSNNRWSGVQYENGMREAIIKEDENLFCGTSFTAQKNLFNTRFHRLSRP